MLTRGELISAPYLAMQMELHARPNGYGGRGDLWVLDVANLIQRFDATSLLDYGCGEGALVRAIRPLLPSSVRLSEYDPAIVGKDSIPSFADLVVSTDVLEHVEPTNLLAVLAHMKLLARKAVFVTIALRASNKTLADGRNAHLIVESADWWIAKLRGAGFSVADGPMKRRPEELSVILT